MAPGALPRSPATTATRASAQASAMLRDIALEAFEDLGEAESLGSRGGIADAARPGAGRERRVARDRGAARALADRRCPRAGIGGAARAPRPRGCRPSLAALARRAGRARGGRDEQRFQGHGAGGDGLDRGSRGTGSVIARGKNKSAVKRARTACCARPTNSRRRAGSPKPTARGRPPRRPCPEAAERARVERPRESRPTARRRIDVGGSGSRARPAARRRAGTGGSRNSPRGGAGSRGRTAAGAQTRSLDESAVQRERRIDGARGASSNVESRARPARATPRPVKPTPALGARRWRGSAICSSASRRWPGRPDLTLKAAESRAPRRPGGARRHAACCRPKQDFEARRCGG